MSKLRTIGWVLLGQLITIQHTLAGVSGPTDVCQECVQRVPEIDSIGAVIAVGLLAGLIVLVREKNRRK